MSLSLSQNWTQETRDIYHCTQSKLSNLQQEQPTDSVQIENIQKINEVICRRDHQTSNILSEGQRTWWAGQDFSSAVPWENLICVCVWSYQRSTVEILSQNTFIIASYCTSHSLQSFLLTRTNSNSTEVMGIIISIWSLIKILLRRLRRLSECLSLIKQLHNV